MTVGVRMVTLPKNLLVPLGSAMSDSGWGSGQQWKARQRTSSWGLSNISILSSSVIYVRML